MNDWLDYIDFNIIKAKDQPELWHNTKTLVLDSFLVLNYIRKKTDNIPIDFDNRALSINDICETDCRNDYFQRFLYYDKETYHNREDLWWVDCWQSIRLNNILYEFKLRSLNDYFKSSGDGEEFKEKWETFYQEADSKKFSNNSLPAFSYLECIRLSVNIGKEIHIDDFIDFCHKLCEIKDSKLSYFPKSNEIRTKSLSIIQHINKSFPGKYNLQQENDAIYKILKRQLNNCKWDEYCHTLAPILLEIEDDELHDYVYKIIPSNVLVKQSWISGSKNFTRKPRFSLLGLIKHINNKVKFFDVIYPLRVYHTPWGYESNYSIIAEKIDTIIQGLKDVKDIQKKIQDNDIIEEYFRDLIEFGLKSATGGKEEMKWIEKEHMTTSGRKADIYIIRRRSCDVPIETKLLWHFSEEYEPIKENLEQIRGGDIGVIIVINPPKNPRYKSKYQGFEGWRVYIQDHETFIPGTLTELEKRNNIMGNLKTLHTISDHHHQVASREKNYTIISFFIELNDYIRSSELSKI